ncbi:MAG: NADH-quinone oxidoreductase subunit D [Nitrospirae bacterium]|nr:NADH-quinone oxidoreductase subunit D [Nitrospirota bacterium]
MPHVSLYLPRVLETREAAATAVEEEGEKELTINMGPQHPSTHGVMQLQLDLEGEKVLACRPIIGYLHRGIEKWSEARPYHQVMPITDRLDYVTAMTNNLGYSVAVEKLTGIKVPKRAQYLRMIVAELSRLSDHLLWLGTQALDIGAMTVFLYAFREREEILKMFEIICGARLTTAYISIGGVRRDAPKTFLDKAFEFTDYFPGRVDEYETLITNNRIWLGRTMGIGLLSPEDAVSYGVTGPALRGSGVAYDLRKADPYCCYDEMDFDIPLGKVGDVYDRYKVRVEEMRQSNRIIRQCLENLPDGPVLSDDTRVALPKKTEVMVDMERLIHQFLILTKGFDAPVGEVYSATEVPNGELGYHLVSNGSNKPWRMRVRGPSFLHVGVLPHLVKGHMVADVIACIGSVNPVFGECDR